MLFKLLKSVAIVIFCWLAPLKDSFAVPSDILSYKGRIYSLRSNVIRTMDIRSDGRYLFVSEGGTSFFALDLNDMARRSDSFILEGDAVGLFMDGFSRLIAATVTGVQYFDVSKPLKPAAESTKFTRPTDDSAYTVVDACLASEDRIIFLEQKSDNTQKLRIVSGSTGNTSGTWRDTDSGEIIRPLSIHCHQGTAVVFGSTDSIGSAEKIFMRAIDLGTLNVGGLQTFTQGSNYSLVDFHITDKQDQLWLLFNRTPDPAAGQETRSDSLIQVLNYPTLTTASTVEIGSKAQALASFKVGESFMAAFFVGIDRLIGNSENLNKLLLAPLPFTSNTQVQTDRGSGSANAGSRSPSRWWSSKSSDYKFGLIEGSGVSLIGQGPLVDVVEGPTSTSLTGTSPLKFKIKADRDSVYSIYFDQSYNLDGEGVGLSREPGNLVRRGNMAKDVETSIEVSVADLGIKTDRVHSLSIIVYDANLNSASAPLTRLGIPFAFDPPPEEVTNLKLRSGDSSIWVYFDAPLAEDLSSYEIHFSYSGADVAGPTFADRTFASGVGDVNLSSPVRLGANQFSKAYAIHPVLNFQDVFVTVIAVDKTGQKSSPSAVAVKKAYPTLTIPQALGGAESCALNANANSSASLRYFGLFLLGILFVRRRLKKNWAQHF